MAKKITAIRRYQPEINRGPTRQMPKLVADMTRGTGPSQGEICSVVYDLRDAILLVHRDGQAVKIAGPGTFTPAVRMDGSLDILFRPGSDMLRELNDTTHFCATILNKSNIRKTADELIAQWNREHPEDPVSI